jgi:hypothetical protein
MCNVTGEKEDLLNAQLITIIIVTIIIIIVKVFSSD